MRNYATGTSTEFIIRELHSMAIRTSDSAMWMTISMFLQDGTHSVYLYVPNEYSYGTVSYFEKGATELFNKVYEKYFSVVR